VVPDGNPGPPTVTKDGVNISTRAEGQWDTFLIASFDPNSPDFYIKEYTIVWENDPNSWQSFGYYLTCNNLTALEMVNNNIDNKVGAGNEETALRNGGPHFNWYGTLTSFRAWETGPENIRTAVDEHGVPLFTETYEWNNFRTKNEMTLKFVDNTNWEVSWVIGGVKRSFTVPTYLGWEFNNKTSIELHYRMNQLYGGNSHKLRFYENEIEIQTISQSNIQTAVDAWIANPTTAEAIYGHISNWDVSQVTDMAGLFMMKTTFNENISNWDVSNVTNMAQMFYVASSFNQDISNWNVSNVTTMENMFNTASSFNQDISNWDVSSLENMSAMFYYNSAAFVINGNSVSFPQTSFNQDISNWDVSNVTNFSYYGGTNPSGLSSHSSDSFKDSDPLYFTSGFVEEAGGPNGLRGTGGDQGTVYQSIDLWDNNHPTYGPSGVMLFNNSTTTGQWHGSSPANDTEFVTFQFPTAKTISRYRMWYGGNTVWESYPHQVWLYGSNNNSTWTLLHNANTSTGWVSTTNAADIGNGVNCKTFDIPSNVQGSYTYYKTQMQTLFQATGSGNQHTNLHEIVLYSGHE